MPTICGALVVLQRTGDDFRRARRAAIDQHHDRLAVGDVAAARVVALGVVRHGGRASRRFRRSSADRRTRRPPDRAGRPDRCAGRSHSPSGRRRSALSDRAPRFLKAGVGVLVERRDADVADIAFAAILHAVDLDDGAGERDVEGLLAAGPQDGERDLAAVRRRASCRWRRSAPCPESACC